MAPPINMIWVGDRLGPVNAACVRSFLRHGHEVVFHCYSRPSDTPDGVVIFDASKLMRPDEFLRYKGNGSPALGSNIYRYRIMREGLGIYADTDVFCVRPFFDKDYVFGYEDDSTINCCVLKLPSGSTLLKELLAAAEDPHFIPGWLSKRKIAKSRLRKIIGMPVHISSRHWGTIGPQLLTYMVEKNGLTGEASAIDIFSPLSFRQTPLLTEKGLRVSDLITGRTLGLHVYNEISRKLPILEDTPLHEIVHS